jgi:CDP-diacylglycerol---glycerol-3-phosphate 3-phosphatidyltransferase
MATMTPSKPTIFNIPNQLTLSRFVLAGILFGLIAVEWWWWCLIVFALAAITDWLDGYVARLQNITSALGRILDPLADKVLICGAYVFLLPLGSTKGWLQPWMVTLVVARELIITSLRSYLENLGARFGADWLGKLKMGLQCAALIAIFVVLLKLEWIPWSELLRDILIWGMLATTLVSGLQYLWRAVLLYKAGKVQ